MEHAPAETPTLTTEADGDLTRLECQVSGFPAAALRRQEDLGWVSVCTGGSLSDTSLRLLAEDDHRQDFVLGASRSLTVPTSLPVIITLIRSARSKTSWMS